MSLQRIGDSIAQLEITDPLYVPPKWVNPMYVGTRHGNPTYATAFAEYTGLPSALGGGAGAVGVNVANQGVQVKAGASIFSQAKYGFRVAWAYESIIGAAIVAGVLTVIDPQHKWEGGLDEWVDYGPSGKPYGHMSILEDGSLRGSFAPRQDLDSTQWWGIA
jgi:hypothetical protein